MIAWILNRLPARKQFWPVLSTVVFIVFTWTIYQALYQVPSWLFYMQVPGVLVLLAYILGFALLESLIISAFLAVYCFILPGNWLRKQFAAEGFLLAIILAVSAYLLRNEFASIQKMSTGQMVATLPALFLLIALLCPLLARILDYFPKLASFFEGIGNRLVVFSYIYIPLGVLGWLVVLIRNLI